MVTVGSKRQSRRDVGCVTPGNITLAVAARGSTGARSAAKINGTSTSAPRTTKATSQGRAQRLRDHARILADDIEEPLPALPLAFYPVRGIGKSHGPQGEAVGPAVDHAAHDARLLQHLQVP